MYLFRGWWQFRSPSIPSFPVKTERLLKKINLIYLQLTLKLMETTVFTHFTEITLSFSQVNMKNLLIFKLEGEKNKKIIKLSTALSHSHLLSCCIVS